MAFQCGSAGTQKGLPAAGMALGFAAQAAQLNPPVPVIYALGQGSNQLLRRHRAIPTDGRECKPPRDNVYASIVFTESTIPGWKCPNVYLFRAKMPLVSGYGNTA